MLHVALLSLVWLANMIKLRERHNVSCRCLFRVGEHQHWLHTLVCREPSVVFLLLSYQTGGSFSSMFVFIRIFTAWMGNSDSFYIWEAVDLCRQTVFVLICWCSIVSERTLLPPYRTNVSQAFPVHRDGQFTENTTYDDWWELSVFSAAHEEDATDVVSASHIKLWWSSFPQTSVSTIFGHPLCKKRLKPKKCVDVLATPGVAAYARALRESSERSADRCRSATEVLLLYSHVDHPRFGQIVEKYSK